MLFMFFQIAYLVICILEAWLEQAVIYLKNPKLTNYASWNKKEHARSAVYACTVGISFAAAAALQELYVDAGMLVIVLLMIRRVGFDFTLKLIRGRRVADIEGEGVVDKTSRGIFGKKGGWREFVTCLVLVSLINYLKSLLK